MSSPSSSPPPSTSASAVASGSSSRSANGSTSKLSSTKGKRGKAGGPGKKGKVFVEDKSSLLSLMSEITKSKESLVRSKVTKTRAALSEFESIEAKKGKNAGLGNEKKRVEREKALNQAKAALLEKAKEKRKRKQAASAPQSDDQPDKPFKKRVGFA
ncbi:hypothetical protein CI109_100871 [Kwoniella shandongensis]|uniref:Uncharacterized protein n=1 Tax=Kwoniella shandongensis TaxID=1734106 RepID=A0A5M6BU00_9TREE|nr:uncharacterized protein CI109_006123 [Kwoniella shandongensis]KAA5525550.1 hypothetical protein CI109_006123 [Kwoniella shandongensis]